MLSVRTAEFFFGVKRKPQIRLIWASTEEVMRRAPYISASGAAFYVKKNEGIFDFNPSHYTSFHKDNRQSSTLPTRAHFDNIRYKTKKPIPSVKQ